jgi:Siphovirus-type tail component, C-terminal domain
MKKFQIGDLVIHDITQSDDLGYALHTPVSGLDFPAIRLAQQDKPGEHGSLISNQLYGGRQVDLTGIVWGDDLVTYNLRRRQLQAAIRIIRNNFMSEALLCKFTTDDGLLFQFSPFASKLKMDDELPTHANFMLTLTDPDPNIYDQNLSSVVISPPSGGGAVYPVTYPVLYEPSTGGSGNANNIGDANTYPIFYFNGPLTNPLLLNLATGETFQVNATIPAGHQLVVDMAKKTMVLDGITNWMFSFVQSNTWISFVPGNNVLILTTSDSDDSGVLNIAFRSAFIGY